jgi:hypothetical protein
MQLANEMVNEYGTESQSQREEIPKFEQRSYFHLPGSLNKPKRCKFCWGNGKDLKLSYSMW